ncbi:hypothetical protein ACWCXL_42625 [Streptomyces sp. NPDC001588]
MSPQDLDAAHQDEQSRLVVTKLMLYTTPQLVKAYQDSNAAFMKSLMAIGQLQLTLVEAQGERESTRRQRNINVAAPVAAKAVEESKAADERLAAALREVAILAPAPQRGRGFRR